MADPAALYNTKLPRDIIELISKHCESYQSKLLDSTIRTGQKSEGKHLNARNSLNAWIPDEDWLAGFIWYYVQKANYANWRFDITTIDHSSLQYTVYNEGQFYNWHTDSGLRELYKAEKYPSSQNINLKDYATPLAEYTRKLSFSLQLSDPEEYTGGKLQFIANEANELHTAPVELGSLVIFDSHLRHRVTKVRSGTRKSLVGWVIGPRWK